MGHSAVVLDDTAFVEPNAGDLDRTSRILDTLPLKVSGLRGSHTDIANEE